jgi:hypothetical protein
MAVKRRGAEPLVRTVAVRVTHGAWRWLEATARARGQTISDVFRDVLSCAVTGCRPYRCSQPDTGDGR